MVHVEVIKCFDRDYDYAMLRRPQTSLCEGESAQFQCHEMSLHFHSQVPMRWTNARSLERYHDDKTERQQTQ